MLISQYESHSYAQKWQIHTLCLELPDWNPLMILIISPGHLAECFLRMLLTVLATVFEKSIQIHTANIKGGLAISAKVILLKFIQLLTLPIIPLRRTKPNWWIDQSACNTPSQCWSSKRLMEVEELFALIWLCHACVFCSLVMLL